MQSLFFLRLPASILDRRVRAGVPPNRRTGGRAHQPVGAWLKYFQQQADFMKQP